MGLKQNIFRKKLDQELRLKDGVVIVDESSCDGCGNCVEVCRHSAIHIKTLSEEEIKKLFVYSNRFGVSF
jgi:ferredoxin